MPYLIAVTVLQAFSFSFIGEYIAGKVDSDFAVLFRVIIAALIFLPFTLWRGLPRNLVLGFYLAGILQFGITYLCLYRAFAVLTVPEVLLFTVLTPIYVTMLDDALARRFSPLASIAAAIAVGGGILIRFNRIEGEYIIGFLLLQLANATYAAGQVLCRRLLLKYPVKQPLHRYFGHFFLGAMIIVIPSFLLFGDTNKLPQTSVQWNALIYMGLIATALCMYAWVKGSKMVDAGTLAIMNELHVPVGLVVNLLIWHKDTDLTKLTLGGIIILIAMWINIIGRKKAMI